MHSLSSSKILPSRCFLERKEDAPDGGAECCSDAGRSTAGDEIPTIEVVLEVPDPVPREAILARPPLGEHGGNAGTSVHHRPFFAQHKTGRHPQYGANNLQVPKSQLNPVQCAPKHPLAVS